MSLNSSHKLWRHQMRVIIALGIVLSLLITSVYAEETSKKKASNDLAAEQNAKNIEICTHNLQEIGRAIQTYHEKHGDYPEWLSELLPKHMVDKGILICPADKKDGEAIHPYTKDPKNAISYDYQLAPKFRKSTMESQILFGDVTPLVRCLHHNERTIANTLSLSFGNKVYQVPYSWQNSLVKIYGSVEAAIDALEDGLQKMPDNGRFFSAYLTLFKLYMKAERKEEAENLIDRFKTVMDTNNAYHYSYVGDMLRAMNRHDEELQLYEELEKQMPKNRVVLERLEKIHKQRGNDELALPVKPPAFR